MKLRTIFEKPVDRNIEGVIKADDAASLQLELEEYVLTNELEKRLDAFLDAYNELKGINGVWISGFFGSGKSHLLKMLAILIENRPIDGILALDLFLPKCIDNTILQAELKRAVAIPSQSILFNIDQKADVISKTQTDALLAVFVKVFDEMRGYYGKQGHIARFERDLDSRGLYDEFKTAYKDISGTDWHKGREQALLESENVARAYAKVTGSPQEIALGILDKYRSEYRVSIEDFAEQVKVYIDQKGPEFRLNFFVDEVGQYIAGNVKLMLNLQTIAESLATKCQGRAWVVVTAQEDMDTVIGEMGKQQGNDFYKIQDRFRIRMKLTSINAAEVIQKRLLLKNDESIAVLSHIHNEQVNNFKTLFDFADGSQTYRNFKDREHFISSYPFIPYQYVLFQSAIQNLSQHNAFEGKHSSVGERSMLGVFQQVAVHIGDHDIGQLAPFDLMFEGIRTALKANIQSSILKAEQQLDNKFAVRLLKALFLVKYVREFKATVRNLCVLMLDKFNQDMPELRKQVEEALNLLEQQTYIQRNVDQYEYLTDEEKDVEEEIKSTDIETSDVTDELESIVFDYIIKSNKIRFIDNGQDYPYSRKLDDRIHGRERELTIHIISPFYEHAGNEEMLRMQNMGRDELMIVMPLDARLVSDIQMYKKTAKYTRQHTSITQQDTVKMILHNKSALNDERRAEIQQRTQSLIGQAKLFIAGSEVEIGSQDAQTRIIQGFHELIQRTYPNLKMLRGITYTENDIATCLKHSEEGLFGTDTATLSEAEQDMSGFIQGNYRNGLKTTLKTLVERFERKPYGWYYAAILCILAKLCARGKIEVSVDSNILEGADLERALRNTAGSGNVILTPQTEFSASQVRRLKEFYADFFDGPSQESEAKALGKETGASFQELLHELDLLTAQAGRYPFLTALNPVIDRIKECIGKSYTWYLDDLMKQEDDLLNMKEQTINPIRAFMSGPQKGIYESARICIEEQKPNLSYVGGAEAVQIQAILSDPLCFKGNQMQQLKALVDALQARTSSQLSAEVAVAKLSLTDLKTKLETMDEFASLSPDQQIQLTEPFKDASDRIEQNTLIAVIRDTVRSFEEDEYPRLLEQLGKYAADAQQPGNAKPPIEYIAYKSIKVPFGKAWLADESDVDDYLKSLRDALLKEIKAGKRIQI
ncbi:MAG: BREX system P-loop protein BrxC [Candidatus Aquicultor secundus]|uniref:BREX system P-loop protein BrxC n=1 Tax=Candidatus Aquicultor secundus TaxID=1973895 RepID=A0A2M7TB22_9ACTN|nr:BREX system P-loop protein BrxC [Candidatus Aquicultor secundus]NCO65434.1 BREX system P-loop protein BrxC [Solirubrobacter sp.]OIO87779.1 MAG: hypothetical protein AUK32_03040 [Candidatus Aquicultor secundus]PIU27309.1 MAG: BREX system P-loop protein BrxC [Candidatus Aquicultor secundus]PIW21235.1 MAG: BREX system P-loop protein BrxC [Candidatus Aquicultor secundus]PIX51597.1 MAG: BREX system P-loop protein BrxC [Candidatus Aquicultor secundus]